MGQARRDERASERGTERVAARAPERATSGQNDEVKPHPPGGWAGKLLLFFPAALFIFLIAVLLWGILADLLAGYR